MESAAGTPINSSNTEVQEQDYTKWNTADLNEVANAAINLKGHIIKMNSDRFVGTEQDAELYARICRRVIMASSVRLERSKGRANENEKIWIEANAKIKSMERLFQGVDVDAVQMERLQGLITDAKEAKKEWLDALQTTYDDERTHYLTRMLYRTTLFNIQYLKFQQLTSPFMADPENNDSTEIDKQAALVVFMRNGLITYIQDSTVDLSAEQEKVKAHIIKLLRLAIPEDAEIHFEDDPTAAWFRIE